MSGEAKGETAVVQFWSPVETRADIVRNPRENQARSAGSSKKDGETITPTDPTIVAAEQWACLLLGFICMACGAWGICMKFSRDLSSGYVSWLGSAYEPTLRVTAVACLVSGAVLVHRGLARPDMSSVSGKQKASRLAGNSHVMQRENARSTDGFRLRAKMKKKELK